MAKPRSAAVRLRTLRLADGQQRANAGTARPGANAPDALRHQHAIVRVERHQVRHRAERDQVEEIGAPAA